MTLGELLSSILINLQSVFKNNVNIKGLTFPKALALLIIPLDGIEMSMLSTKLGVDNSTTTRLIIGMETDGLVERKSSKKDRRVICVFLTKSGEILYKELELKIDKVGVDLHKKMQHLDKHNIIEALTDLNWALIKKIKT